MFHEGGKDGLKECTFTSKGEMPGKQMVEPGREDCRWNLH